MSYENALKHWKNHGKDRYCQQCSGYAGHGDKGQTADCGQGDKLEKESFYIMLDHARCLPFPAYVYIRGWIWHIASEDTMGAEKVGSFEELELLGERLFGKER